MIIFGGFKNGEFKPITYKNKKEVSKAALIS